MFDNAEPPPAKLRRKISHKSSQGHVTEKGESLVPSSPAQAADASHMSLVDPRMLEATLHMHLYGPAENVFQRPIFKNVPEGILLYNEIVNHYGALVKCVTIPTMRLQICFSHVSAQLPQTPNQSLTRKGCLSAGVGRSEQVSRVGKGRNQNLHRVGLIVGIT
jgi:hypothetical protein